MSRGATGFDDGYFDPPSAGFAAFPEGQLVVVVHHDVFFEIGFGRREVLLAADESMDEVVDDEGGGPGGDGGGVGSRVAAKQAEGGKFVTHAGITCQCTSLMCADTERIGLSLCGIVGIMEDVGVEDKEVGIADDGFCFGDVVPDTCQREDVKVVFVQDVKQVWAVEVALGADDAQMKQIGVKWVEEFVEVSGIIGCFGIESDAAVGDGEADHFFVELVGMV